MGMNFKKMDVKTVLAIGKAHNVDLEHKLNYQQYKRATEKAFLVAKNLYERKSSLDATQLTPVEWDNIKKEEKEDYPLIWGCVDPIYHSNYYICAMQDSLVNDYPIRRKSWLALSEWDIIGIQQGRNLIPNLVK